MVKKIIILILLLMSEIFTKNFSYDELYASPTAARLNINNEPDSIAKDNLRKLANRILQPIRDKWRGAIIVTSGYRSERLNKVVGGAKTSQHLYGEAADITVGGRDKNKKLFNVIYKMIQKGEIEVGQLIDEYNYKWIHVSLPRKNKENNQILHVK